MPVIYLEKPLTKEELEPLKEEFFQYQYFSKENLPTLASIEILYGDHITEKELMQAHHLKWIHSTKDTSVGLPIYHIKQKGILVSLTKGQNIHQMAEFVIGAILAFAKQFFHWPQAPHDPDEFWDWPLKDTMWALKDRTILQVGLGPVGTEIVKMANILGLKTWGIKEILSFHPYCHKTFQLSQLSSLLSHADIISIALPYKKLEKPLFTKDEFSLMKRDSILIVIGAANCIEENDLYEIAKTGKFRGILLDTYQNSPLQKDSPLWEIPGIILTPHVATQPEAIEHTSYHLFRKNLRHFTAGHFNEMHNLI